jgi:hypothetical protein
MSRVKSGSLRVSRAKCLLKKKKKNQRFSSACLLIGRRVLKLNVKALEFTSKTGVKLVDLEL